MWGRVYSGPAPLPLPRKRSQSGVGLGWAGWVKVTTRLALDLDAERLHVVAARRGGALDCRLLLIYLADLLVELAVALRHLAGVLRNRSRRPRCRGTSAGWRRWPAGVRQELVWRNIHPLRLLVEGGLVLLNTGHRLLAVFAEDCGDLVLALVDLGKMLRRLRLGHNTAPDIRGQLIVGHPVTVIGLPGSDDRALHLPIVMGHVIGDQQLSAFGVGLLLHPGRRVGGARSNQCARRCPDQRATPIAATGNSAQRRAARRSGQCVDRHHLLKLLILLSQQSHRLIALRIIVDLRHLRHRRAARRGAPRQYKSAGNDYSPRLCHFHGSTLR